MVFLPPRRLRDKFWPEPLPHTTSFNGQTVLITGATTGLGLAAAVHFADLGATVLITSRSLSQGNVAKDQIEAQAGIVGQGRVFVMELDLSRYSSCVSFIHTLKATEAVRAGLDVAVLNAGLINTDFVESPEGWYALVSAPFPETFSYLLSQGADYPSEYPKYHSPGTPSVAMDETKAQRHRGASTPDICNLKRSLRSRHIELGRVVC